MLKDDITKISNFKALYENYQKKTNKHMHVETKIMGLPFRTIQKLQFGIPVRRKTSVVNLEFKIPNH